MTFRPLEIFKTLSVKHLSNRRKRFIDEIFLLKNLDLVGLDCIIVGNKTRHASHSNSAPGRVFDFYGGALSWNTPRNLSLFLIYVTPVPTMVVFGIVVLQQSPESPTIQYILFWKTPIFKIINCMPSFAALIIFPELLARTTALFLNWKGYWKLVRSLIYMKWAFRLTGRMNWFGSK